MSPGNQHLELLHMQAQGPQIGPPLLFLHGGFHGAWCWADHFMPWFASRGFDCHAVSYRDHGQSWRSGRHKQWRLRDYVDDARWAARQIIKPPILIGHSLGGSIAQKLAAEGGYAGLILLAPSPIGGSNRAALRMLMRNPRSLLKGFSTGELTAALPAFSSFFLSDDAPPERRDWIARHCNGLTSLSAANDAFYFDPPQPGQLECPVLVVSGKKDWSIPRYKNEKLARSYAGQHIIAPTAHDIMCDTGWEDAAALILGWLDQQKRHQRWN